MKLRQFNRSVLVAASLGSGLFVGQVGATSVHVHTATCGHIVTPPPPPPPPTYVKGSVNTVTTIETTPDGVLQTDVTTEILKFVDPTLNNGSDTITGITFASNLGGLMKVGVQGESSGSKLVVASTRSGTLGLGVDSCNRIHGVETSTLGSCGTDADLDFYRKGNKTYAEAIKILFAQEVTLDSVMVNGAGPGEGLGVIVVDALGHSAKYTLSLLSAGNWGKAGGLVGQSFMFFAMGCDPGLYLSGLRLSDTSTTLTPSSVPEPQALALLLAGLAVVGGVQRRRAAA